jgi:hypothetical protein
MKLQVEFLLTDPKDFAVCFMPAKNPSWFVGGWLSGATLNTAG